MDPDEAIKHLRTLLQGLDEKTPQKLLWLSVKEAKALLDKVDPKKH